MFLRRVPEHRSCQDVPVDARFLCAKNVVLAEQPQYFPDDMTSCSGAFESRAVPLWSPQISQLRTIPLSSLHD